jgi:HEPN domain-containing protein
MTRADFQALANERINDADALLNAGRFSGAYYNAGFAVECALKACVARNTRQFDFPLHPDEARKTWSHDLNRLLEFSGLSAHLASQPDSLISNWNSVKRWQNDSRYNSGIAEAEAQQMYLRVTDATDGVLPWLRTLW